MLESVSEVHYTPTGFPLPIPTLTNPSPAEQSQGREKTSTGPEIRRSAKRGMLKRSLPCSARRCSRGRERGMCLLAAGEPGNAARRLLPGGGKGWTERCERLRGGHGSAQVRGWAGVSSGRDAASALIAGTCVAKKKKKLVQPIAPILPGEACSYQGHHTIHWGGKPQPAMALCQQSCSLPPHNSTALSWERWDAAGWEKPCCRQLHSQTRKMRHRIFAGGCISRFLSCPNNRLSMLKPFLEAQLYITFRFIDRVCRTQNKQRGCISSEKSAGREGTQLKTAQKKIMPKEEPFLQSRHEKSTVR